MSLDDLLGNGPNGPNGATAVTSRPKTEKPTTTDAKAKTSVEPRNSPTKNGAASPASSILFFDLETIPDYERRELFELDAIPEPAARCAQMNCPSVDEILKGTLDDFKQTVLKLNPTDDVLDAIDAAERLSKKPRKGVFDITSELRRQDQPICNLIFSQRKIMSVTPEMNRIIALGWSVGSGISNSMVVGDKIDERQILEKFWSLALTVKSVCGFNILGFDLPTIFVRSILLDVAPTREFDLKPWGADVIDLMKKRFPAGQAVGLKKLCRMLGIPIPAGDVDGSQVEELWKSDPIKVGEYVRSDVDLVKELHRRYRGLFC